MCNITTVHISVRIVHPLAQDPATEQIIVTLPVSYKEIRALTYAFEFAFPLIDLRLIPTRFIFEKNFVFTTSITCKIIYSHVVCGIIQERIPYYSEFAGSPGTLININR